MTQKRVRSSKKLPKFGNIQEATEFFDTNNTADYVDKNPSQDVFDTLHADPGVLVPIRLQPDVYAVLKEKARELHLSPASLARRLLIEKPCQPAYGLSPSHTALGPGPTVRRQAKFPKIARRRSGVLGYTFL